MLTRHQLITGKAFSIDQCLLAVEGRGNFVSLGFGNLDIVAENLVGRKPEGGDTGFLPDFIQIRIQDCFAAAFDGPQCIKLCVKTGNDDFPFLERSLMLKRNAICNMFCHDGQRFKALLVKSLPQELLIANIGKIEK